MNGFFYLMQLPAERAEGLEKCSRLTIEKYVRKHRPQAWLEQGKRAYFPRLGKRVFTAGAMAFVSSGIMVEVDCIARKSGRPLFADKDLQQSYSFYEPVLLSLQGIDSLIHLYQVLVIMQYVDVLMSPIQKQPPKKQKQFLQARAAAWASGRVLNLDPAEPMITEDSDWEHEVFDLLRVRQMDWKKNRIVLYRE